MRPDLVILFEPLIDHGLGLTGCAKQFGIKEILTKFAVDFPALLTGLG
jgi:hypothetical protein